MAWQEAPRYNGKKDKGIYIYIEIKQTNNNNKKVGEKKVDREISIRKHYKMMKGA